MEVSKTLDLGSNPSARANGFKIGSISIQKFPISRFKNFKIQNMNKITTYFKESYKELMEKVTWPTWIQLQQSTIIVIVATLFITAVIWVMDFVTNGGLKFIYNII
jgi:preprotein translocase subunit SecE